MFIAVAGTLPACNCRLTSASNRPSFSIGRQKRRIEEWPGVSSSSRTQAPNLDLRNADRSTSLNRTIFFLRLRLAHQVVGVDNANR